MLDLDPVEMGHGHPVGVTDARHVGEEERCIGAKRRGDGGGSHIGVDVKQGALRIEAERRDHRHDAAVEQ